MIVIPGPIPIAIHPFFWLLAGLIGWMYAANLAGMVIWIGIIFVSVLVHEFGHALTAVAFKQRASIQLVALGGLTSYEGPKLKFWKQFLIVLNGPLFGFGLFLLASFLLQLNLSSWPRWEHVLRAAQMANLFWTIVNLLPILPLDGGQLLRIVLEGIFGVQGLRAAMLVSALLSALFAVGFFMIGALLGGSLFFLFAYQGFDAWRKSRLAHRNDRDEERKALLDRAEDALEQGRKEEARALFEKVRETSREGVLAATAGQFLAILAMQEGKRKEAFELLSSLQNHLADDMKCLLLKLAGEFDSDALVESLSVDCYQIAPSQEMALLIARAFARLHKGRFAGGWLQTAWQYGGLDLGAILKEAPFQALRNDPEFNVFVEQIEKANGSL